MISERLIKKREEAGLKQAELARRIGVGRDSYNRYERSATRPSLEALALIANELNTTTDYLLGNTDNPQPYSQKAIGFAERFLQLRKERQLTQEEIAVNFSGNYRRGCTQDEVARYENGRKIPNITSLMDFADYFGVSEAYLLGDSDVREAGFAEYEHRRRAKKLSDFGYDEWLICKIIDEGDLDNAYDDALMAPGVKTGLSVRESGMSISGKPPGPDTPRFNAVIQLDEKELSLITDFRDIDECSKNDLCQMAEVLAENSRLKKMLKK